MEDLTSQFADWAVGEALNELVGKIRELAIKCSESESEEEPDKEE
jgi:hypothetical protein